MSTATFKRILSAALVAFGLAAVIFYASFRCVRIGWDKAPFAKSYRLEFWPMDKPKAVQTRKVEGTDTRLFLRRGSKYIVNVWSIGNGGIESPAPATLIIE